LISKIIENGILKQIINSILIEGLPVINQSFCYVFDFIKIISITEKGKQFIKDMNIFEKIVMP
jgi:predicted transcriptional regulator